MVPALDAFLFHLRLERNLSEHTVEAYARDLNRFVEHVSEGRILADRRDQGPIRCLDALLQIDYY